ncbi:MAG: hypothetical protein EHM74_02555, partial [Hyphomicrobiales bacterium]
MANALFWRETRARLLGGCLVSAASIQEGRQGGKQPGHEQPLRRRGPAPAQKPQSQAAPEAHALPRPLQAADGPGARRPPGGGNRHPYRARAVRRVIDNGFIADNVELVNQYFAVMLAVVLVLAVGSATRFYFVMWLGERVVADIRDAVFSHLLHLSPSFYETQRTGEVLSRLTADTTQIKSAFSSTASIALRNLVMLIGTVAMMVYTSPRLAGLSLLAIPLVVLPLVIYGRKVRSLSREAQDELANSAAFAQERLNAMTTVQSNVQERASQSVFAAATERAFGAAARRTFARAVLTAAIISVALGSIVLLLWYGASEVLNGNLTSGTLSQFLIYAILAASSLGQLSEVWGEVQLAAGAAERISELLDEKPGIAPP